MSTTPYYRGVSYHSTTKGVERDLPVIRPRMIEKALKNGTATVMEAEFGRTKVVFEKGERKIVAIVIKKENRIKRIISLWEL